jgi:uracil-DNA glycosylase
MNKNIQKYWESEIKPQLNPLHNAAGNLLYYVFQTSYHFQPELLIVGINPGGDYDGEPFLARETNWYTDCKRDEKYNHSFNRTLCDVFGYGKNDKLFDLLENAVGTNMTFFNTGSVEKLNNNPLKNDMIRKCASIVKHLIDEYIQPKRIVCIGRDSFNALRNGERVEQIKLANVNIDKSHRNNIPLYYIPNPSRINLGRYFSETQKTQYQQYFEQEFLNL